MRATPTSEPRTQRGFHFLLLYTNYMHNLPKWKTTHSQYIVNDRWMKLRADTCVTPAGHEISPFYVIEYPNWITCLVLSDEGEVTLLRHYRHGIDDYVLEVVAGMIDD